MGVSTVCVACVRACVLSVCVMRVTMHACDVCAYVCYLFITKYYVCDMCMHECT